MSKHPPMPTTLDELAHSTGLPVDVVRRLAAFVRASITAHAFRELVDPALELLGGTVPDWPALEDWNRWCFEGGMSFFVWPPSSRPLDDRRRLEVLLHCAMMLGAKERNIIDYRQASITDAGVIMAGDDCVICDEHRHHVVRLDEAAVEQLPPFHPGCRCGTVPHLT